VGTVSQAVAVPQIVVRLSSEKVSILAIKVRKRHIKNNEKTRFDAEERGSQQVELVHEEEEKTGNENSRFPASMFGSTSFSLLNYQLPKSCWVPLCSRPGRGSTSMLEFCHTLCLRSSFRTSVLASVARTWKRVSANSSTWNKRPTFCNS